MTDTEHAALQLLVAWRRAKTPHELLIASDSLLRIADELIAERQPMEEPHESTGTTRES